MRRPADPDPKLAALLREAALTPITPELRERQLISFAYGNAKLSDERVTREQVAKAVRELRR